MAKAMKIVLIVILSLLLILETYNIVCKFTRKMDYRAYDYYQMPNAKVECKYDAKELKSKIDKLFNQKYIYIGTLGNSKTFIPLRIVFVNENVYLREYAKQLAHELCHLKYQTRNEMFVTYKTIVELYESGDEFLKYVAVDYANEVWAGKFHNTDYDCGAYLIDYFNNVT